MYLFLNLVNNIIHDNCHRRDIIKGDTVDENFLSTFRISSKSANNLQKRISTQMTLFTTSDRALCHKM